MSSIILDASANSELHQASRNDNSSHFIRKSSMFDKKFGKKLLDSIVEVVEGFDNDSNIDSLNEKQPSKRGEPKETSKLGYYLRS